MQFSRRRLLFSRALRRAMLTVIVLSATSACQRSRGSADATAVTPVIERVAPNPLLMHAGAPAELEITGRGFALDSNTVSLGPHRVDGLRSTLNGTRVRLTVPERMPGAGGMAPPLWVSGTYALVVQTRHGRSDSVLVSIEERR